MDIFILRDGKEIGPFDEETTQSMLKQGSVLISDLAWRPGMPQWIPLHSVLYPAPAAAVKPPPPPPVAAPAPDVSTPESATPRQKAFLNYMGVTFPAELTKEQAALLVNDTMENPKDSGRLARWNEERLRLHPELFAAEIKTKKENRSNYFFQVCQREGAEVFTGVTKAHCQVLVGFLDVRFPNWDANEREATWDYFFPALAEKFPQVVNKAWKGRLKYPEGPRVAPELRKRAAALPAKKQFPVAAIVRGVVMGGLVLAVIFGGLQWMKGNRGAVKKQAGGPAANSVDGQNTASSSSTNSSASSDADASVVEGQAAELQKLLATMPPPPAVAGTDPDKLSSPNGGTADAPPAPATNLPTFDPATPGTVPPPPVPQPKTTFVLTKPTEVQLPFGRAKLPAGTQVKLVAQEGTMLRVRYGNDVILVPASSTDFATPAATPLPPATFPPAATPPPPPVASTPPATPPPRATPAPATGAKESLF